MPKATIKMQQTQPLIRQPGATGTQSGVVPAPAPATTLATTTVVASDSAPDTVVSILSIAALLVALASLALVYLVYTASSLS
jgi:hypothetical protein